MLTCPRCGHENPEADRFCGACGSPLAIAPPPREERKVVTVLFCDLVGSTARAERMDPEDVRALLSAYHGHVRTELERFGATVEKFIGDAVMALFGAPTAHEDDPERAVRAALAIRDWARDQDELKVRIGITTGEALVALGSRPEEGEGMAAGDVVNTAARLQAAAAVNGILVDETTYHATARAIEYREQGPVEARGKGQPVPVWEAVDARARLGVDVRQHGGAPLVGRDRELSLLTDALDRVREEREPQLVTLIGVPGIGKSRLVFELFQVVDREPEFTLWRQGRSLAYGDGVTFWALGEMVKAQAGILDTDPTDEAEVKLERAARSAVGDGSDAEWVGRLLRPLVGLSAERETAQERSEVFSAWRRFLEGLADQRPLVLVFEDMHWADDDLLDFVDELVEWVRGVPMLVVATARPELLARRPGWGGGKANATTLSLQPLTEPETARLVRTLLDRALMRPDLQEELLARAGGNPLYAEEFARMVGERGPRAARGEAGLPESIQGIIAARLDALPPAEKALLQDASVVGKVFWEGAVAEIGELDRPGLREGLHALERKEFVRRERRSSVAGETEHAFRHVLVRDVSYGQIPRAARARKHRAAAEWIESLTLDRSEDKAEMLAYHYATALELAQAAGQALGDLPKRAQAALSDAGDRALALNAPKAAEAFYRRALELLPRDATGRPELLFRRGHALHVAGDTQRFEVLEEARDELTRSGDPERAAEADAMLAQAWWYRGIRDRAFEHQERAEALLRDRPESAATAQVLSESARLRTLAGQDEEGIRIARAALPTAEASGLKSTWVHLMITMGMAKVRLGDESGIEDLERGLAEAVAQGDSFAAARAGQNLAEMAYDAGDLVRGRALAEDSLQAAQRLGGDHLRFEQVVMAWFAWDEGRWDDVLEFADGFIAESERSPHTLDIETRWLRASIRLARDMVDEALMDLERAVELGRAAKDPQSLLPAMAMAIRGLAEAGKREEAHRLATEFVASPDAAEGSSYTYAHFGWVARELGLADPLRALLQRHRRATRWIEATRAVVDERFEDAAERFAEIGTRPHEAQARLRAARQLLERGRREDADVQLGQALEFFRSVGAVRYLREGEVMLAGR